MGAQIIYSQLKQLALTNFFDIAEDAYILPGPLNFAPHHKEVKTNPHHFHNGAEEAVEENTFGYNHEERFLHFMEFIKNRNATKNGGQKVVEKK